jgi:ribonuclease T2
VTARETEQEPGRSGGRRHKHHNRGPRGQAPAATASSQPAGTSGTFDFYVMSLSWSPGFCATAAGKNDPLQCGGQRNYAFVLHGLWPQYEQKGWPENCSTESVDQTTVQSMLNIMPSPKLVEHEWEKHGTCSGLSPHDYFEEATEAFENIKIPQQYQAPKSTITTSPAKIAEDFIAANPKFGAQGFSVLCSSNGRYLQEIHACLTKELEGRSCNQEVLREACRSDEVILRPVR